MFPRQAVKRWNEGLRRSLGPLLWPTSSPLFLVWEKCANPHEPTVEPRPAFEGKRAQKNPLLFFRQAFVRVISLPAHIFQLPYDPLCVGGCCDTVSSVQWKMYAQICAPYALALSPSFYKTRSVMNGACPPPSRHLSPQPGCVKLRRLEKESARCRQRP